ncbi:peptidoglycan hydrolase-like protein with peptidoglycan-binding domain [Kineosphaera limosa]|uniref:Resuscitation-promoting factor core lysozyme-like domain-containing protein n=1 Tax=Kineosphaera limosa NBRC 100340 TaxID=1184609 RepID=K6WWX4_9MICO|nr:transglycosylase family protein [Kineosphaera limosa]NYD99717.1 peptidoglycan hydrolase-like protein with peptidoglycan-binding domain [Kineosphaera limosa]GAB98291.1 hypothetical protein KILIM_122_00090 [Kineosphaera limosa NBRC 100340]
MRYLPKHSAARKSSMRVRAAGVVVAAGAVIGGGMAAAPAASAAPSNVWDRVAACESGGNWSISTGNGYYGGLQFSASSWRAAGGTRYASLPHRASKAQQIAAAQQLLRMQGPGAWPTCSKRAGLTRANGLAAGGGAMTASRSADRKATSNQLGMTRTDIRSLQRTVGARVDGIVGPETVRKTERHLNVRASGARSFAASNVSAARVKALV